MAALEKQTAPKGREAKAYTFHLQYSGLETDYVLTENSVKRVR